MRLVLPILLLILGLGAGAGAGLFLRGGASDSAAAEGAPDAQPAGAETAEASGDALEADPETPAPADGATEFVRLNNQFVVPIVRQGSVQSLVVMALTLEVDAGTNSQVFDREPRLRDAFLQAMFAHANAGGFDGAFTEAAALAPLRAALAEAANGILGPITHGVLIVDITRQDA